MAGKSTYYQGMASAPQVQPADLVTPFANMFERLRQDNINKVKTFQAAQKEQERINRSRMENFYKVVTSSDSKGYGLDNFDMVMKDAANNMVEAARINNQLVNAGEITNDEADARMLRSIADHRKLQNSGNSINSLLQGDLKLGDEGSLYNDLMLSFVNDAKTETGLDISEDGSSAISTRSQQDGSLRRLPMSKFAEFFQVRRKTDLSGVLDDIVDASEPRIFEGKNTVSSFYLDYSKNPEGELTIAQANVLTKRLQNFTEAEVYDAAARAGIVGDDKDKGQIPVRTDLTDESLISNIDEIRDALAVHSINFLRDKLKSSETRKPRTKPGGDGKTNKYSIYDNDTGKYSYLRNSQTAFSMKSGFTGANMIDGKPSGENTEIPPGTNVTSVKLTPFGLEVWGTQIKDKEGKTLISKDAFTGFSDEEVSSMGGNRVNFHKVIDPNENAEAIGELQRVFGFDPKAYKKQLSLNPNQLVTDDEETIVSDLNDPNRY
jgi:hypothetical protein